MTQIEQVLAVGLTQLSDGLSVPANLPRLSRRQTAHNAKQTGFTCSIRAPQKQQLATSQPKSNAIEQRPLAAYAFQLRDFEHF
jgi:hypothetical protein